MGLLSVRFLIEANSIVAIASSSFNSSGGSETEKSDE
jgi:hypothetical protein